MSWTLRYGDNFVEQHVMGVNCYCYRTNCLKCWDATWHRHMGRSVQNSMSIKSCKVVKHIKFVSIQCYTIAQNCTSNWSVTRQTNYISSGQSSLRKCHTCGCGTCLGQHVRNMLYIQSNGSLSIHNKSPSMSNMTVVKCWISQKSHHSSIGKQPQIKYKSFRNEEMSENV